VPNRPARYAGLGAIALLLFVLTVGYRFLAMGGAYGGFEDDEFVTLAYGHQIANGDVPVRDFIENGSPLAHYLTAAAISLIGPPLLAEAVLTMSMLGLCAAVLFLLAERISTSIPIAMTIAVLQIAMAPRFYNYPKLLAYAIAIPAIWFYIEQPRRLRLFWIALAGAIAFLLRHDHGAYVAVAALVAVVAAHWPDVRTSVREVAVLGVLALALVAPYLVFVQRTAGLFAYVTSFVDYSGRAVAQTNWRTVDFAVDLRQPLVMRAPPRPAPLTINVRWKPGATDTARLDAERALGLMEVERLHDSTWKYALRQSDARTLESIVTDPRVADTAGIDRGSFALNDSAYTVRPSRLERVRAWIGRIRLLPGVLREANAIPFLYYCMLGIPVVALFASLARAGPPPGGSTWRRPWASLFVVAVLGLMLDYGLLRANLASRLADPTEVIGVSAAWVAAAVLTRVSRIGRVVALTTVLVMTLFAALSIGAIENVPGQLAQTRVTSGLGVVRTQAGGIYWQLSGVPPVQRWSPGESGIAALAHYVHDCTLPDDRLLEMVYAPQIGVMADRSFAGGLPDFWPLSFVAPGDQQIILRQMRTHRVPIAVVVPEPEYTRDYAPSFPSLVALLTNEYRVAGFYDVDARTQYRVLVRSDLTPTRMYPRPAWPCFN